MSDEALKKIREALEFYANQKHILYLKSLGKHVHLEVENGTKAREALKALDCQEIVMPCRNEL
jgi:type II secretory pathway component PulF